ncbi:cystathionine gamma-synthase, converts cysteine into cystathionine [Tirmania nivea]|nr:cystathionine gamma-synthase, converts cysteine into cystathionine [Tirmania nivea]
MRIPKTIQTATFHALPPAPRHAITTHLPTWECMIQLSKLEPEFLANFVDMYPRILLHKDIKQLIRTLLEYAQADAQFCLPFPSLEGANDCRTFITAAKRSDGLESLATDEVSIRVFEVGVRIYCIFFPAAKTPLVMPFWCNAGVGISSRLAEEAIAKHAATVHIRELALNDTPSENTFADPLGSQLALRVQIAHLMERAPLDPHRPSRLAPGDVYIYQTGMAAIYFVHNILTRWSQRKSKTVMFGFPFHQTTHIFEYWGHGFEFFPLGTEFDALEKLLEVEPVLAVWTEFPSNPLLVSSDLTRLRHLADRYRFALVVDDTVGSFCNIDVLGVADIVVSSLTKSFSGYADVMGGSVVLCPSSQLFAELKVLFEGSYHNNLYPADAEVLLRNSADYLSRSKVLNENAALLAEYLQSLVSDKDSSVSQVYYPTVSPTKANYDAYKRPPTPEYQPGYGCLFSVEFDSLEATIAFYDNLHVHNGPHLGAHLTLALPYTRLIYPKELEKVEAYGLRQTQIRISVGLEEPQGLLETFKYAIHKANMAKRGTSIQTVMFCGNIRSTTGQRTFLVV